jgi:hypothetical protein
VNSWVTKSNSKSNSKNAEKMIPLTQNQTQICKKVTQICKSKLKNAKYAFFCIIEFLILSG